MPPQTEVQYRCSGVQYILQVHCQQCSVAAAYTRVDKESRPYALQRQHTITLHIYFLLVAVYLKYTLQSLRSVYAVYTAPLLHFGLGPFGIEGPLTSLFFSYV